VTLRAYFDESGTHWGGPQACDVFVLCGYLGTESLWDDKTGSSFDARWKEIMHGKPFHATEMESNPQGATVKPMLANLVINSGIVGIGGGVHIPSFKRLMQPHIDKGDVPDDPYLFLFGDVICEAVEKASMFLAEDQNEPIGFVFAKHERWSALAAEMYTKLEKDPETPAEVRRRMGTIAFEDMERFIPLQAADHIAYESYRYMNDHPATWRPTMARFMSWPQNNGRYYNEQGLLSFITHAKETGLFDD